MNKTFAEKSVKKTFLGMIAVMSAASTLFTGCNSNTEKEKISSKNTVAKKPPVAKVHVAKSKEVPEGKRVIYLTFDDGPNRGTQNFLQVLRKRKVYATAFLVGRHASDSKKQREDLVVLKKDTLIELANHSYEHAKNQYAEFYKKPDFVVKDFNRAKDSLRLSGNIARTPGRNIWRLNDIEVTDLKSSTEAANNLKKAGYTLVGWDLEWKPTKKMTLKDDHKIMLKRVDSIFFNDLEKTSKHLVLLTHDQYLIDENSLRELDLFIDQLQKSNRFVFRKISDYPKIDDILN